VKTTIGYAAPVSTAATLRFLGGAGTVTGSKYLIETPDGARVLIDCGLFQGRKELRLRNWARFEPDPSSIDAIVLTHAHVDHCGYVPRLCALGFSGPIYCTEGTASLVGIVLPDSGRLQAEEAAYANRVGYSKHQPAMALYDEEQALAALEQLRMVAFHDPVTVAPGVEVTWHRAGHILGAAWLEVHLTETGRRVVFSGDLGRGDHPLLLPPDPLMVADTIVCESTYGDQERPTEGDGHTSSPIRDTLVEVITDTARRGGVVVIPAFAVDRTEIVLHHLDELVAEEMVPNLPIYVDSPMASAALSVYRAAARSRSVEIRPELHGTELFPHIEVTETRSVEQSRALSSRHGPMIVISASGMATGGRVLHHLAARLGDDRNTVVLVGFQAPGTRGERLASGAKTVKLLGAHRAVAAGVRTLLLSAHADQLELTEWLRTATARPDIVYLTHGEPSASQAFAAHLGKGFAAPVVIPTQGECVRLDV